MGDKKKIVLDEHRVLIGICGANDVNLKELERLLDAPILTRGNEIILDSGDSGKQALFTAAVKRLEVCVKSGQNPGRDLVRGLMRSLRENRQNETDLLNEVSYILPGGGRVFPRSYRQGLYMKMMSEKEVIFSVGPAGTGKTFLAIAYALQEVLGRKKKKLILTRPVVEAGESLGFLPGDLAQKLNPYLRPLYDAMDALLPPENISRMEENRIIEIAPLAYMRGRSLTDSIIILDEAQNTTREQMKMFLTRLGEGSQAIITGDITQVDLPDKRKSGLIHSLKILRNIGAIHFSLFDTEDVVRKEIVRRIIEAYETEEK